MNERGTGIQANPLHGERRELAVRIAWMYYVEGLRQEDIANRLNISRLRVIRLLASARDEGIVRIEVDASELGYVDTERRLCKQFGLKRAILVPTPIDPSQILQSIGTALGSFLNGMLQDGMTIGVNHGRSVHSMFHSLRAMHLPNANVVSLMGNLSPEGRMVPQETVARLALALDARCYQLATPKYARSSTERDLFIGLPMVQSVLDLGRNCDLAVFTASRASEDGGLVNTGYLDPHTAAELRSEGAVGAVLGAFVDGDGQEIDHPINELRIGVDLADLERVPNSVLVGGGSAKVVPLLTALKRGHIHNFVTDIDSAKGKRPNLPIGLPGFVPGWFLRFSPG